jgi:DNA repair exonuclease SbcCD ATPase subunit
VVTYLADRQAILLLESPTETCWYASPPTNLDNGNDIMDKTVKIRAFTDPASGQPASRPKDHDLELAARDAQLEDERSKSLEQLKTIVQLRESLKQEQARTTEVSKRVNELESGLQQVTASCNKDLARKDAQIEAEMKRAVVAENKCKELQDQLKQEQAKLASMPDQSRILEAKEKELTELRARVQDMTGALNKIVNIAEIAKLTSES